MPRLFCPAPLAGDAVIALPAQAARHVQVLRLQPGDPVVLFDGRGGEWQASIERMGRSEVVVAVGAHVAIEREAARLVHLAVGMPANERMDWLVEKATELGVASVQPLQTAHAVVRLAGDRIAKKQQHWQAIAQAACEQCGRNRVPVVHAPLEFSAWLGGLAFDGTRTVLSLRAGSGGPGLPRHESRPMLFLSGPEGGLSPAEEDAAVAAGFAPLSLGSRVLRAETAALAALAALTVD